MRIKKQIFGLSFMIMLLSGWVAASNAAEKEYDPLLYRGKVQGVEVIGVFDACKQDGDSFDCSVNAAEFVAKRVCKDKHGASARMVHHEVLRGVQGVTAWILTKDRNQWVFRSRLGRHYLKTLKCAY